MEPSDEVYGEIDEEALMEEFDSIPADAFRPYPSLEPLDPPVNSSKKRLQYPDFGDPLPEQTMKSDEDSELLSLWTETFVDCGIPISAAKIYAMELLKHGLSQAEASTLSEDDLESAGVANASHRDIIIKAITQDAVKELESCWNEVFIQVGIPEQDAALYAAGFGAAGIDGAKAGAVSEEDLLTHGIHSQEHRLIILNLIQKLLKEQQSESAVDWDKVQETQETIDEQIKYVEGLELKISKILAGDTKRQRAFKHKLAEERKKKETARQIARHEKALKRAERAIRKME